MEQEPSPIVGAMISINDGSKEAFKSTDVNKRLSLGLVPKETAQNLDGRLAPAPRSFG